MSWVADFLARLDRGHDRGLAVGLDLLAVDFEPAGADEHLAEGLERFTVDAGDAGGLEEFGRRIENGQKPAGDEVVDLLLGLAEVLGRLRVGMMAK
jgi:hypothetical protein